MSELQSTALRGRVSTTFARHMGRMFRKKLSRRTKKARRVASAAKRKAEAAMSVAAAERVGDTNDDLICSFVGEESQGSTPRSAASANPELEDAVVET